MLFDSVIFNCFVVTFNEFLSISKFTKSGDILEYVAVGCNKLEYVAAGCNIFEFAAAGCDILEFTAAGCNKVCRSFLWIWQFKNFPYQIRIHSFYNVRRWFELLWSYQMYIIYFVLLFTLLTRYSISGVQVHVLIASLSRTTSMTNDEFPLYRGSSTILSRHDNRVLCFAASECTEQFKHIHYHYIQMGFSFRSHNPLPIYKHVFNKPLFLIFFKFW